MDIDIFIPCFIDQVYPKTGFNMIKVLKKLGCKINYNTNQTCCGQPSYNGGYKSEAYKLARKFLNDFKGDKYIVTPSASCAGMIKFDYENFFDNTSLRSQYKKIQDKTIEFTQFLTDVLKVEDVGAEFEAVVTYHDSCSAFRSFGLYDGPRRLLNHVKKLSLVEMNESTTCCGFGGTFSVKMEPISAGMGDQKTNNAMATNAQYLVTTDSSCIMHIEGMLKKKNSTLKTMHIADVLAQGY